MVDIVLAAPEAAPLDPSAQWLTVSLPYKNSRHYVMPRAFFLSSMFSTRTIKKDRPYYTAKKPLTLSTHGHILIKQTTGPRLDSFDATVVSELVKLAMARLTNAEVSDAREARVQINSDEFIQALGEGRGGRQRKRLAESIARLNDAAFHVDIPGLLHGSTRLVLKYFASDLVRPGGLKFSPTYDILLDLDLPKLMGLTNYVLLRRDERIALRHCPLAQGLLAFFANHKDPKPFLASTLKPLMDREDQRIDKWLRDLEEALVELKVVTGWHQCKLNEGRIHIVKRELDPDDKKPAAPAVKPKK